MSQSSVTEQFVRTVGTFALLGPLVGVAAMWTGLISDAVLAGNFSGGTGGAWVDLISSGIGALLISVPVGYVIGVIPAAVVGAACHFFARAVRTDVLWIALCTATGTLGGVLTTVVMSRGWHDGTSLVLFAATGGVAAAACSFKLRRVRWT